MSYKRKPVGPAHSKNLINIAFVIPVSRYSERLFDLRITVDSFWICFIRLRVCVSVFDMEGYSQYHIMISRPMNMHICSSI